MSENETFKGISKIKYDQNASKHETLVFKFYNSEEEVLNRKMKDWLRFSVCFWHTFKGKGMDPFGGPTIKRVWDNESGSIENAKRNVRAAFEFMSKLGVDYYTFHDLDVAPEGENLKTFQKNLDIISDLMLELQKETGIKPLWGTCNLFSHPRYMNGAATNPDSHVFAYAAAQVKKGLDLSLKLGAENFVFWGGREGYQTILNTDLYKELSNMAQFFKMALAYKEKIGFKGQFLIEPKPKEPSKHQYDYDVMTVIGFLRTFGLEKDFKINVEPNHTTLAGHSYEHDVSIASAFKMLGSIDANTGSPDLGWDTDQFPMDIKNCTLIMNTIIEQNGLAPGGLNFDAKVRRESVDVEDMFIAHIGAMDTFARALRIAASIYSDELFSKSLKMRYISYETDLGARIADGQSSLEECEEFVLKHGEPNLKSGKQEYYERLLNNYL